MEARQVETRPPALIEGIVRTLMPPLAREGVLGDFAERYRSPGQYALDAIASLPMIVSSQVRRSSSLPVLGLQVFILFACLGGFSAAGGTPPIWLRAAIPTAAAMLALILRDAYRTTDRYTIGRAVADGLTVTACVALTQGAIYLQQALSGSEMNWMLPQPLLILAVLAPMMLCVLRFGLGVDGDAKPARAGVPGPEVAGEYALFQRRIRGRNIIELAIGIACIAFTVFYLTRFQPAVAPYGWAMLAGHASAMLYIALRGWVRPAPSGEGVADSKLSHRYGRELMRLRIMRQYLWWWYLTPLFVGLFTNLIGPGIGASDPTRILLGAGACIVLFICIAGFNREQDRKVKEKVDALSAAEAA
jgi:hypothetical protein